MQYLREYKHLTSIEAENLEEKKVILKKTGTVKIYVTLSDFLRLKDTLSEGKLQKNNPEFIIAIPNQKLSRVV